MTVLTMVFNQSSISWRVGEASVADLESTSGGISDVRYEADNLYPWGNQNYSIISVWDKNGKLRADKRAIVDESGQLVDDTTQNERVRKIPGNTVRSATYPGNWDAYGLDDEKTHGNPNAYTVNVMSAGPNGTWDDYDDIWSFPDEFN